jgi:transcriptional regulator with XRE-family HTH domain
VSHKIFLKELAMAISISNSEAMGRTIAAARMMAGLDQAALAEAASVSAGTVSNIERGREVKSESVKSVRNALARHGVLIGFSRNNGLASVSIAFVTDEGEED